MKTRKAKHPEALIKAPTGIHGLDEVTAGGLPKGRPTLVCGGAGSGKTLLALEFLVRGAMEYGEPGVFMAFEESADELACNVASLGMDLRRMEAQKKLFLDIVVFDRSEVAETGRFDLGGLFLRLEAAIDAIGARRVAIDALEVLFAGLSNHGILRSELRRLFRWLKDKGVTAVITGERGGGMLTRCGLEEYVADCVIVLDHRVNDQVCTRRLRIVKYRGTAHGSNEYPFLIGQTGFSVLPITSMGLNYEVSSKRVSTGVARLDTMLGGQGYFRGSSILISGAAGSGKSSLAAAFAHSLCRGGERCLYVAFEESPSQIFRNMRSIGYELEPFTKKGLLRIHAIRPASQGLESHLAQIDEMTRICQPAAVLVDPITSLLEGNFLEVNAALARITDLLKARQITALFTSLTNGRAGEQDSEVGISSLMDTWLLLHNLETDGERSRGLYILKSRGMGHSNQIREFVLSDKGIQLVDAYVGLGKVLTGTARMAQQERERADEILQQQEVQAQRLEIERRRAETAAQIKSLGLVLQSADRELERIHTIATARDQALKRVRTEISLSRMPDEDGMVVQGGTHDN